MRDAERRQRERTRQAALDAWDRLAADFGTTPFTHLNSRGHRYFLHATPVTLPGGGSCVRHYFSQAPKPAELVVTLPAGYTIVENPLTGVPLLTRRREATP